MAAGSGDGVSPYELSGQSRERVPERVTNGVHSTPLHSLGGTPQTPLAKFAELERAIKAFTKAQVTDFIQHVWIEPLGPVAAVEPGPVVHMVAPDFLRSWVRERYSDLLAIAGTAALGADAVVELVEPGWTVELAAQRTLEQQAKDARRRRRAERSGAAL